MTTDELVKKLNTTGAFDTPWLKEQLANWNVIKEQQRAEFIEHIYYCYGRQNKDHPFHATYSGLWNEFCIKEAGPYCREEFFKRLEFIRDLEEGKFEGQEVYLPTTN
jgi:hypothetical protein